MHEMRRVYDADPILRSFDARVAHLAGAQHGVISRAQLECLGATKGAIQHRVRTGRWDRLAPDVFRLVGGPSTWRQSLMAACMAWGEGAVVSHRAAAGLWRLAGFVGARLIELTIPRARQRKAPGIIHRNALATLDVTTVEAIPVTTPVRTLIDLAAVAPVDAVEEALDDALRRGMFSPSRLRKRVVEMGPRRGIAVVGGLIDAREPTSVPQSVFETRLLRVLRRAGLPDPVAQHRVRSGGRLVAIVDFAYPDARLAIEADGYRWHSGRARWEHDRARRNELTLLGWRIVHVTWTDLDRDPDAIVERIRSALEPSR